MATAVATTLLKFTLKEVGSAAAGKLFEKGLDLISGGSDADKIQESISGVLKEVQETKALVTEMSKKLDDGILKLRTDTLNVPKSDIESYFENIQDCFNQAIADRKEIRDEAKLKDALTKLQTRLETKLKLAADNVPGYLHHVNDFLQDKTFLNDAASLAWQKSDDFLAYYVRMKVLFMPYWIVVVKGITLLEMARSSPKVSFDEAPATITRLTEQVGQQEDAFSEAVGKNTCILAEFFLAKPNERRPIAWFSGWGCGIDCIMRGLYGPRDLTRYNVPRVRNDKKADMYRLEVVTNTSVEKFDLSKSYPIRIWASEGNDHIERSNDGLLISMWSGACSSDSSWFIKPITTGSDQYRFVGSDGANVNAVLVTGWNDNTLEHRQNIDVKKGFDDRADRAYFQLKPWI
ncbi:hypothetical protein LTS10_010736 [Elasticomyces elasticus]|nr:hypothetical protein LTS10_010736 [Elasticomyces elasticus]